MYEPFCIRDIAIGLALDAIVGPARPIRHLRRVHDLGPALAGSSGQDLE